ncbi:MAG: septum formation initiator family protein [Nocardioidaceae bacterium]
MTRPRRPHSGPGRSRRPGDRGGQRPVAQPTAAVSGDGARPRSRVTGRAVILGLVLAVLTISYASSMRAYLQQRSHITDLKAQIAAKESSIADLEREKARWDDPAFVREQARKRFGYMEPGETAWVVVGADGKPLDDGAGLSDPADIAPQEPTAWWDKAWGSVELAGHPPPVEDPPATRIRQPADKITSGSR